MYDISSQNNHHSKAPAMLGCQSGWIVLDKQSTHQALVVCYQAAPGSHESARVTTEEAA
jgi:hypothetical protein